MVSTVKLSDFAVYLGDYEQLIFLVGKNLQRYMIHRQLILAETKDFDFDSPHVPLDPSQDDPNYRLLSDEIPEVFDLFVSWLYDCRRSFQDTEDIDYVKLVKLYLFALTYHVDNLKRSIITCMVKDNTVDFDDLFTIIEKVFAKSPKQGRWEISHPLDTFRCDLLVCENLGIDNLLRVYYAAYRRGNNRLMNAAMETLQDTLLKQSRVLTVSQVEWVFEHIEHTHDERRTERLRIFCVALFHHMRFSGDFKKVSIYDTVTFFNCDDFIYDYLHFEQEVVLGKISTAFDAGDDPRERKGGSFPQCYFHVHDVEKNEPCHRLDQRQLVRV